MSAAQFRVVLTPEDLSHYPFVPEALSSLKDLELTLEELAYTPLGNLILEKARERLLKVVNGERFSLPEEDHMLEVAVFYTTLLILAGIGDDRLTEKFSTLYSKAVHEFLLKDLEKGFREKLLYIAVRALGWDVCSSDSNLLIHFKDFVFSQPEFTGEWKLSNRVLERGYVRISWRELARLLETGVKKHVASLVQRAEISGKIPEGVYRVVEEVSRAWSARQEDVRSVTREISSKRGEEALPPCIRELLHQQLSGKNLPHSARFALASFLLNIGFSVEETLEVFRRSPDFREDVARYQVEHIAGLRGSRVKYLPYKCDNMRSYGLCRWMCEGVKHPLQYFYRTLRGRRIKVRELW
uniref:DNA primase large subunit PriL n=1 Tax=Thermofilum pendens TaxID=2269 RepID=A0A7C4FDY2_THEPE